MISSQDVAMMTEAELVETLNLVHIELARRDVCEHGITSDVYCDPCSVERKKALAEADRDEE